MKFEKLKFIFLSDVFTAAVVVVAYAPHTVPIRSYVAAIRVYYYHACHKAR